ncbi:hypothetical protein [Paenibacillus sp. RC84]|uniref:hypothetical protein n=1 Tax=Paenibacillus sp. RC84 TaxID=3156252 RepID=UPI0035180EA0
MEISSLTLLLVTFYTGVLLALGLFLLKNQYQKVFYALGLTGMYLYSGIGTALNQITNTYLWYYLVFTLVFTVTFIGLSSIKQKQESTFYFTQIQSAADRYTKLWFVFLCVYSVFNLFPLVFPEFKLMLLVQPPKPNLLENFYERFGSASVHPLLGIHEKIKTTLFPFFLIGLYALRKSRLTVLFFVAFYLYTIYCIESYIGRFVLIQFLLLVILLFVFTKRMSKKTMVVVGLLTVIAFTNFYSVYREVRLGVDLQQAQNNSSFENSANELISKEFFYSEYADTLIQAGQQVDFQKYVLWMLTLPIPKEILGGGFSLQLNNQITTFLTGQDVGKGGTYVHLVSVVGESIYIYGNYFFWMHAILIGFIFSFLCRLTMKTPALTGVSMYMAVLLLIMARGGISSTLPVVVNYFILLYAWMFFDKLKNRVPEEKTWVGGTRGISL